MYLRKLRLPPEDPLQEYENEKEQDSFFMRPFSYISKYTVTIPRTAISGLVGEMADQLEEFEDTITRVSPTVQAWTPTGDIFIGCLKGHILKVCKRFVCCKLCASIPVQCICCFYAVWARHFDE